MANGKGKGTKNGVRGKPMKKKTAEEIEAEKRKKAKDAAKKKIAVRGKPLVVKKKTRRT